MSGERDFVALLMCPQKRRHNPNTTHYDSTTTITNPAQYSVK